MAEPALDEIERDTSLKSSNAETMAKAARAGWPAGNASRTHDLFNDRQPVCWHQGQRGPFAAWASLTLAPVQASVRANNARSRIERLMRRAGIRAWRIRTVA